jgi:chromosomal replication initiation ATPase DnaA
MRKKPAAAVLRDLDQRDLLELVAEVCERRGTRPEDLCARSRRAALAHARHELWAALRDHPERYFSLAEIGRLFGVHPVAVASGIRAHRAR